MKRRSFLKSAGVAAVVAGTSVKVKAEVQNKKGYTFQDIADRYMDIREDFQKTVTPCQIENELFEQFSQYKKRFTDAQGQNVAEFLSDLAPQVYYKYIMDGIREWGKHSPRIQPHNTASIISRSREVKGGISMTLFNRAALAVSDDAVMMFKKETEV